MIKKASELLESFIQEETKKLKEFNMSHMPTLGTAYEEITKQGLDRKFIIPKDLNLKVVSGFIIIGKELCPEQIDCMLVKGEEERYGLTEQYIYPIEQVLCIFEVKKTLRKSDFHDAYFHLSRIRKKYAQYYKLNDINKFKSHILRVRKSFSKITGRSAPEEYCDINYLSSSDQMLFESLLQDSLAPISIIHGYGGYKTESGLRKVFIDFLENTIKDKENRTGFGVVSFPSLVTSNEFCLVKGNGFPSAQILRKLDEEDWAVISSSRYNPTRMILELIWTKISIYFDVTMPWGDDLDLELLSPLVIAKAHELNGSAAGWIYGIIEIKEEQLKREIYTQWKPYGLSIAAITAIRNMAMNGGYLSLTGGIDKYLSEKYSVDFADVYNNLIKSREFMRDGDHLRPISSSTYIIINDDDSGFISSEKDRFDNWCTKNDVTPHYMILKFINNDEYLDLDKIMNFEKQEPNLVFIYLK